jgi:hypothetical protein
MVRVRVRRVLATGDGKGLVQRIWLSDTDPDLAQDLIAGLKLGGPP